MKKYVMGFELFCESLKQGKEYLKQGKIEQAVLDEIVTIDPTKNNKYVGWLCKQYIHESFDIGSIKSYIEEYDVLVNKKSINADINSFKSINVFKEEIDKVNSTRSASLKELQTDFDVILDNDVMYIVRPNSYEASRKLGLSTFAHRNNEQSGSKDSAWCTTYSNSSHWNDYYYNHNVTFYYCKIKDETLISELNKKYKTNSSTCDLTVFAVAVLEDGTLDIYDANDAQITLPKDLTDGLNITSLLVAHIDKEEREKQRRKNIIKLLQQEIIDGNLEIDFDIPNDIMCNTKQINGYVWLRNITHIPKFFKNIIVKGSFDCSYNNLTTLEGVPQKVGGDFLCSYNKLTSLEGAPNEVKKSFYCHMNNLTSLEGAPQKVGGDFMCSKNKLTTLEGVPQKVGGVFMCYHNQLTSLEGAPKKVGGNFYCNNNKLTSLDGAPKKVGGNLDCGNNNLTKEYIEEFQKTVSYEIQS
jgi:hypothetical protein